MFNNKCIFDVLDRKNGGQSGIISCIAVSPTTQDTYALGSYAGSGKKDNTYI